PRRVPAIGFPTHILVLIHHPLRSATSRADGPLNLHRGVIDLLQRVRVAVLGLDVATLLGDDVEKRAPTQFIALPNDVQVPTRDVADAALVDLPAPPCRFILHERRLDLLASRERRELHAPARGPRISVRAASTSARPASARATDSPRSAVATVALRSPPSESGASGVMPASALSCSVATSTRLASNFWLASSRLTSTSARFSSSAGAAPCLTRSWTIPSAWRLTCGKPSVTRRLRRAASTSPAFMRTSPRSRRSRSPT